MKFQVVSLKPMEGVGKESKRPYKMLICSGIYTNADGTVELGEVVFMERAGHPIPTHLKPGQSYVPVVSASSRQGRLQFEIVELKEMTVVGAKQPAAVAA